MGILFTVPEVNKQYNPLGNIMKDNKGEIEFLKPEPQTAYLKPPEDANTQFGNIFDNIHKKAEYNNITDIKKTTNPTKKRIMTNKRIMRRF